MVEWHSFVITGLCATGVASICNILAVDGKCPVSDNWQVIGATGAVGAFLGAKLYDCVDKK